MNVLGNLKNAILQRRGGAHAMYEGVNITGCCECGNNKEFPGLIPGIPTHKCIIASTDGNESLMTIFDPYGIPDDCPIKLTEGLK